MEAIGALRKSRRQLAISWRLSYTSDWDIKDSARVRRRLTRGPARHHVQIYMTRFSSDQCRGFACTTSPAQLRSAADIFRHSLLAPILPPFPCSLDLVNSMASSCIVRPSAWTSAIRTASRSNNVACAGVRRAFTAPRCLNTAPKRPFSHRESRSSSSAASTNSAAHQQPGARVHARSFSTTPRNCYKTVEEAKSRYRVGVSFDTGASRRSYKGNSEVNALSSLSR